MSENVETFLGKSIGKKIVYIFPKNVFCLYVRSWQIADNEKIKVGCSGLGKGSVYNFKIAS